MNFKRLLHSSLGKIIISILIGLGLATLFRKVCNDRSCLVFFGPKYTDIDKKTFSYNNKCYTFEKKTGSCDKTIKVIPFA